MSLEPDSRGKMPQRLTVQLATKALLSDMEVIHLSLIRSPAHKSRRLIVALWGVMVLSEAPKEKPPASFSCTSPSLVSLCLHTPSSDENRSPQRIPASHWLVFHRSGWWGERESREEGKKAQEDATTPPQHPHRSLS